MKLKNRLNALLIAGTLSGGLPFERMLMEDDPGAGGGGGGGGGAPATFTQEQVNAFLAKERGKLEKQIADLKPHAEASARVPELEKQLEEMRHQLETAGKSAEEKSRIAAERAAKQLEADRAQREKELGETRAALEAERAGHRMTRTRHVATTALTEAKAFAAALPDALGSFLSSVDLTYDEKTGEVATISYGGVAQKTMKDAAAAFLKDRPYFAAAPATGGSGTPHPNAGGRSGAQLDDLSSAELMSIGLSTPPRRGPGHFGTPTQGDADD